QPIFLPEEVLELCPQVLAFAERPPVAAAAQIVLRRRQFKDLLGRPTQEVALPRKRVYPGRGIVEHALERLHCRRIERKFVAQFGFERYRIATASSHFLEQDRRVPGVSREKFVAP